MKAFHAQLRLLVALLLAAATPCAVHAADEETAPRTDCDPEKEASWPACTAGTLCWCAGDVEYRRDKVILNDLVLYQGGSPLLVRARRAETPSTDTADSTWNLSGGVRSRLAQGQLAADNATVHFESSNLTAAMFDGKPATFEEAAAPAVPGSTAPALGSVKGSAHTIEYDNAAGGEVRLRGDVQLFDGCKDIHGDGFVYKGDTALNRLTGTVTDVVYQGESLRIFLVLPDGTALSLRQPSHHEAYRRIPPLGGSLTVTLHPEDTIIVPKAPE
jgi:hypothetical protein